jgi:phosphoribosylglycinamide formyltransferase-1
VTEKKLRLAVLASGGGTNLQAILDRSRDGSLPADVVAVVSDNPGAFALERAKKSGVPAHVVEYGAGPSQEELAGIDLAAIDRRQRILRQTDPEARLRRLARLVAAERRLIGVLDNYAPDYICLAGWMRLVTPYFLDRFNREGRYGTLNIHPALLPAFPGEHGYEDTLAYGCRWGGVTVHFVDEGEDSGPVIAQAVYPIWPGDDIDAVRARGLGLEYEVYAQCIRWLAEGHVEIDRQPGSRPRVTVTDPEYGPILGGWVRRGMGWESGA